MLKCYDASLSLTSNDMSNNSTSPSLFSNVYNFVSNIFTSKENLQLQSVPDMCCMMDKCEINMNKSVNENECELEIL